MPSASVQHNSEYDITFGSFGANWRDSLVANNNSASSPSCNPVQVSELTSNGGDDGYHVHNNMDSRLVGGISTTNTIVEEVAYKNITGFNNRVL